MRSPFARGDAAAASELLQKATKRWGGTAAFGLSSLAPTPLGIGASRVMIDRRDFMVGTALVAIAPPLELLPPHRFRCVIRTLAARRS